MKESVPYYLGIDVGGTKYHLRVRRLHTPDIDAVKPSAGNLSSLPADKLVRELSKHVNVIMRRIGTKKPPTGVCIGVSGLDSAKIQRDMMEALLAAKWWKDVDPNARFLTNDIAIGMRAGTESEAAIAIISGTGSNGFGVDELRNEASVSGRGYWLADEGSGTSIGHNGLRAMTRAEDGRGPQTRLLQDLLQYFKVHSTAGVLDRLKKFDQPQLRREISFLNGAVEHAAEKGDMVAGQILDKAADELILMATTIYNKLDFGRNKVDTVLIGGTINRNKELLKRFLTRADRIGWMRPVPLNDDPVEGAINIAMGQ